VKLLYGSAAGVCVVVWSSDSRSVSGIEIDATGWGIGVSSPTCLRLRDGRTGIGWVGIVVFFNILFINSCASVYGCPRD